jgi:hypothetical protein
MMRKAILLMCISLFGCAAPRWEKADIAGKVEPTQDVEALRKTLIECHALAAGKNQELDTLFGSESTYTAFEKCMHDKGYTQI